MEPSTLAGIFVVLANVVSAVAIVQHLRHYTKPRLQIHILRILLMVPVYSVQSWLSLTYPRFRVPLGAARDCYEAYVLYEFLTLMIEYVGGEGALVEYLEVKPNMRHPWPLQTRCRTIQLGRRFLRRVRQGILQFVLVRPASAALATILDAWGVYFEGQVALDNAYTYLALLNNVSVSVSLYSLVLFYMATETRLESFSPVPKFLAIKAVLFFSFWQSCALATLSWLGVVESIPIVRADLHHAATLQDFLICIEMLGAAAMHHFAFPFSEFRADGPRPLRPLLSNLFDVLDVQDVLDDAHQAFLDKTGDQRRDTELHSIRMHERDGL